MLLSRVRSRMAPELLIAAGSLAFAAVAIGAAMVRELLVLCPVMLVGGVAWISVLSTLTVAAQQASPPWVRARAPAPCARQGPPANASCTVSSHATACSRRKQAPPPPVPHRPTASATQTVA